MNMDEHLLADVLSETLEQFAFLFGEPEDDAAIPSEPGEYIEAAIGFVGGGRRGRLRVAAPAVLCREMAGNILGMEEADVSEDAAMDAIKELSNVLIGSLTARRLGVNVSCSLDTPTARKVDVAHVEALAACSGALRFRVDEHLAVAVLDEREAGA